MNEAAYRIKEGGERWVAELTGLEGPFVFPEKLLQRIWSHREFDLSRTFTTDGRRVAIRSPGKWNFLGGPDFRDARLELGGVPVCGDVEVHIHAGDWRAHGHTDDPAYRSVVLHVVLFPTSEEWTSGCDGARLPILPLLPLLYHDLEEYAADAAVAALANRPSLQIVEWLGHLDEHERRAILRKHAATRWRQKVRFAGVRLARLGWSEACHQTALEILGYRFNRVPMLRMATARPLAEWGSGRVEVDAIYTEARSDWALQGVRPANQPRTRLRQYARWCERIPDWPERLYAWGTERQRKSHGALACTPREFRRVAEIPRRRDAVLTDICAGAVTGSRLDTLVCDGFLPLLAAREGAEGSYEALWWNWYEGDVPSFVHRGLKDLALIGEPRTPSCHGLSQGLIGGLLARETSS